MSTKAEVTTTWTPKVQTISCPCLRSPVLSFCSASLADDERLLLLLLLFSSRQKRSSSRCGDGKKEKSHRARMTSAATTTTTFFKSRIPRLGSLLIFCAFRCSVRRSTDL
jgi:hypothetical protein